jgi:hypothetical protein
MNTQTITGHICIGEHPNTVCFIPSHCIIQGPIWEINRAAYQKELWPAANLGCNEHGYGGHLFPIIPLEPAPGNHAGFIKRMEKRKNAKLIILPLEKTNPEPDGTAMPVQ